MHRENGPRVVPSCVPGIKAVIFLGYSPDACACRH